MYVYKGHLGTHYFLLLKMLTRIRRVQKHAFKKVRNLEVYKLLVEEEISPGSYINIYISVYVYIYISVYIYTHIYKS